MKTIKYILLLLLIVIIGFSIYVAVQPNDYSFNRSKVIKAPKSLLYNKVNDFKNWPDFSPWLEEEPNATISYGENTIGEGGTYSWDGEILGKGGMTTLSATKNEEIKQRIDFIKPFEATSNVAWNFETKDEGIKVTWSMEGKQDFMTKLFTVFMGPIEKETGPDFERGLFKLDSIIKEDMKVYSINVEGLTQHSGGFYLYKTISCKFSEFQPKMQAMLGEIGSYALTNNIRRAGSPFILYHKWDEPNDAVIFSTCYPTNSRITTSDSSILTGQLEPFNAVKTTLNGNYSNLKEAWEKTMAYMQSKGLRMIESGPMLETYITDAMLVPNPADWITEIFVAVE